MRKPMIGLLLGGLIPAMTLLGAVGHAEIGEHKIKFATAGAEGSPIVLGMKKFAEIVEARATARSL